MMDDKYQAIKDFLRDEAIKDWNENNPLGGQAGYYRVYSDRTCVALQCCPWGHIVLAFETTINLIGNQNDGT